MKMQIVKRLVAINEQNKQTKTCKDSIARYERLKRC